MTIGPVNRSIRFPALLCLLTLLLASCSILLTTAAPPVPTQTTEISQSRPAATAHTATPELLAAPTPTTKASAYWPTDGWRTSSPEAQSLDSEKLDEMLAAIKEQDLNLHSLLIIRHGYLVSENYFGSYQPDTRHELYSVTKSFIATLIGIALDKGYLQGTDQRIVDFFPERTFANLDHQKSVMTLDDTLTMRTGLDWHEGEPAYQGLSTSPDWIQYVLDEPMVAIPGSQFNYCSGCSHVLSTVLSQTTSLNTRDFAEQYLFKPLGITNARWDVDAEGIPNGGWGLQLTPRDMAKLGYLYLQDGQWDGQQIVSAEWVKNATRTHTQTDGELGYGYQWWTYPALQAYTALGLDGQTIFVIPEKDLIVVTTAATYGHDQIFQLIEQYIVPAVQE